MFRALALRQGEWRSWARVLNNIHQIRTSSGCHLSYITLFSVEVNFLLIVSIETNPISFICTDM